MRFTFTSAFLAIYLFAAGVTADETAPPLVIFGADTLAGLAGSADPKLRRRAPDGPPYWNPRASAVQTCKVAVAAAEPPRFVEPLDHYALQFMGVTRDRHPRIIVRGFCSRYWSAKPERAPALRASPSRFIDGGPCFFRAWCTPDGALGQIWFNAPW